MENYLYLIYSLALDPRPQVQMSNQTIYIDEGSISNPMIAWIQVGAYNVTSNEKAPVELIITKGN